jgi:hypothetical protein
VSQPNSTHPEARVYFERIEIKPRAEDENVSITRRDAVAESRRYVVRYKAWRDPNSANYPGVFDEGHVHFFPDDDSGDTDILIFDITPEKGVVRQ